MSPRKTTAAAQQKAKSHQNKKITQSIANEDLNKKLVPNSKWVQPKHGNSTRNTDLVGRGFSSITPDDSDSNGDSDHGEQDDSDEDKENEAEEPDEIAPSDTKRKKRGHQTGISISLSNTKIDGGVITRKRAWSNRVHEEEEIDRRTKASKPQTDGDALTSDDDDDYDGVDLISESDDDKDMEKEEEKLIIQSEEENDYLDRGTNPQNGEPESWEDFPDAGIPSVEENTFFSEHFSRTDPYSSSALYPPGSDVQGYSSPAVVPTVTRRVRFVDEVEGNNSSNSSGSDDDNDVFPDLFLQQDKLDASFRKMLEQDGASSDGEGSYWDLGFHDDQELDFGEVYGLDEEDSDMDGSSSGYETDEGETTDEEVLTPATVNRPQALLHFDADSTRSNSRKQQAISNSVRRAAATSTSARQQGPSIGSWIADPTKPIAIVDKTGKNMIFYPAQRPKKAMVPQSIASSANASPSRPFPRLAASAYESENDRSDTSTQGIFVPSPANLMMSGFTDKGADNDNDCDRGNDVDVNLDIHDFIDFGDASAVNEAESSMVGSTTAILNTNPVAPRHPTAFRRHQMRAQGLDRDPRHISRQFAIKSGRNAQANKPISPIRKPGHSQRRTSGLASLNGIVTKRRIDTVKGK